MANEPAAHPRLGRTAPGFTLPADSGETVKLADLRGSAVVLYFYPKDDTPGCTTEALEFRKLATQFEKGGVRIFGISPDSVASHCKFIKKHGLNFSLLADEDHRVAEKYGAWVEKSMYGRTFWGVQRTTFLIDAAGKIASMWPKVTPKGHAMEVLEVAKGLVR